MNYAMVRNSSFLPLQSYEKNASISWLSPISTEQFSVEGASLDIFFLLRINLWSFAASIKLSKHTYMRMQWHVQKAQRTWMQTGRRSDKYKIYPWRKNLKGIAHIYSFSSLLLSKQLKVAIISHSNCNMWPLRSAAFSWCLSIVYICHTIALYFYIDCMYWKSSWGGTMKEMFQ